jgi:chromosome segregation ATPase
VGITAFLLALWLLPEVGNAVAQTEAGKQQPPQQTSRSRPASPVVDKTEPQPSVEVDPMQRVMSELSKEIGNLAGELRGLRNATERNSGMMELLLCEERLARVEDKIQAALDTKAQLDAREQDIQRRTRNIQQELIYRGAIRRDEAEAQIRAEFQRALDDIRSQQSAYHQRVSELTSQAERLRQRVEVLRKKYEPQEEKKQD